MQQFEFKMKKVSASHRNNKQYRKEAKDKDKELHKLRKELIDLKHSNQSLQASLKTAKEN